MKALVFDQATANTGWALGTEDSRPEFGANDRFLFGVIKAPKREEFGERLFHIWREATILVETHRPDIIGFEEPYFPIQGAGSGKPTASHFRPASGFLPAEISADQAAAPEKSRFNPETLKQLQMVKGLVLLLAASRGIPVAPCTPSQWRLTVLGYGRKPKDQADDWMKKAVREHFRRRGFDVDSYDASDALGILWHTLHGPEAMKRRQGDLLSMAGANL